MKIELITDREDRASTLVLDGQDIVTTSIEIDPEEYIESDDRFFIERFSWDADLDPNGFQEQALRSLAGDSDLRLRLTDAIVDGEFADSEDDVRKAVLLFIADGN